MQYEHIIQHTGLSCLLQETEERANEAEAKILTGRGGVSYILQCALHTPAQHPQAMETGGHFAPPSVMSSPIIW